MIVITSSTYSTDYLLIKNEYRNSRVLDVKRRMTRTATLDGGCEIEDLGYTASDRTFEVMVQGLTEAEFNILLAITQTYPLVVISTREGFFKGAPDTLTRGRNDITTLKVLIKEKLS